jgi:eukaryotic-like serine/threonine-protein kinase
MALPPDTTDSPEPVPFGPFLLLRRLAVGGSSEVFLAKPREGNEPAPTLVIKRLRSPDRDEPENRDAFSQEARLHQLVQHPNVVRVFGAAEFEGEPYLAMEHIDGTDAQRLLRRLHREGLALPWPIVSHIGRSLAIALAAVHNTADEDGNLLRIVHRDVTPSNVYLSRDGAVFLGDFGIARKMTGRSSRPDELIAIKGKHGYLAPEQVNGERADHRADLFSLAVCIAELLLGSPLFEGDADFAVLLSIRDGRVDNLNKLQGKIPEALLSLLRRGLARRPEDRFHSAGDLAEALRDFVPADTEATAKAIREWVRWATDTEEIARRLEASLTEREPAHARVAAGGGAGGEVATDSRHRIVSAPKSDRRTRDIGPVAVRLSQGQITVSFARLIEMIVTGDIDAGTQVNWLGDGFRPVAEIEVLERHLPDSLTTQTQDAPGVPDLSAQLAPDPLLRLFAQLHVQRETGLLIVEGGPDGNRRKEAYFQQGLVEHISSADGSELLGQSLLRRGIIASDELDLALAMLSRFDGRLGDTLLALGLLDTVQLFQALQEQGKERLVSLFERSSGLAVFYRGIRPSRVEAALAIDLVPVMLAGVELAFPGQTPIERHRAIADRPLRRGGRPLDRPSTPRPLLALVDALGHGTMPLRHLVMRLSTTSVLAPADALRALDVAVALSLIEIE